MFSMDTPMSETPAPYDTPYAESVGSPCDLLPPHEISSAPSPIDSLPSEPPSPNPGPFTPTDDFLSHSFADLTGTGDDSSLDADLGLHLQSQLDHYNPYAWSHAAWPTPTSVVIAGDDFDLDCIPPAELGMSKQ